MNCCDEVEGAGNRLFNSDVVVDSVLETNVTNATLLISSWILIT